MQPHIPTFASTRRLIGALLLAALGWHGSAAAQGVDANLNTHARLAQSGWVPPDERRFLDTRNSFPGWDGSIRSQWQYRTGTLEEITFGGAYARALRTGQGTPDAAMAVGVSAQARAVATAAGTASASAQGKWIVTVAINPFVDVNAFGVPAYLRLMDRFGCLGNPLDSTCETRELGTTFQHVSTGRFAHSVQPSHKGVATFRESVTITPTLPRLPQGGSVTFSGSAVYDVSQSTTGNNLVGTVSASGGWTADDFVPFTARSARGLSLYPEGDRRNDEDDRNGPMAGEALLAIRQAEVKAEFSFSLMLSSLGESYLLPAAYYEISIDQMATAGFGSAGYGWGTVAADFDNTARTTVLSVLDPTGALDIDPAMLQVTITAVPEASTFAMFACGLAMAALRLRRRRGPPVGWAGFAALCGRLG